MLLSAAIPRHQISSRAWAVMPDANLMWVAPPSMLGYTQKRKLSSKESNRTRNPRVGIPGSVEWPGHSQDLDDEGWRGKEE